MILFRKSNDLKEYLENQRSKGITLGFVPTMGALHEGHLSLVQEAKGKCELVVASIFVNPTQFNNVKDLDTYPRTIENDIRMLISAGCDILFHPEVSDIYHDLENKVSTVSYGKYIEVLEGEKRPGHFDGVATVLTKLFNLVSPNQVFFGQKDFQQCMVVSELITRDFPTIVMNRCPIKRESDGLAMSSRNIRLSVEERQWAPKIYEILRFIETNWREENWQEIVDTARSNLSQMPYKLDYLEVCEEKTLMPINHFTKPVVVLVAVYLGETRLIDNLIIT